MQYFIDGKPVEGVPTRPLKNLTIAREKPEADAVLISTDDATRRFKKILRILYGFFAVIIIFAPPALVAIDPDDWTILVPIVLAIWAVFAWFLPFMYRRKTRQFAARMQKTNLPDAPGTKVRADQNGLAIGAKSWNWSGLSIESIGLQWVQTGGENSSSYTILQSLGIVAGSEHIQLDANILSTGIRVLDQIYRRLKLAE